MEIKYIIESFFALGLFVNAVLFIPQFHGILKLKDSKEISLITFSGFLAIQGFTVLHGILMKDVILIVGNLLSMLSCGAVIYLTIYYRVRKCKS